VWGRIIPGIFYTTYKLNPPLRKECMHASAKNAQEISLKSVCLVFALYRTICQSCPEAMSASCTLCFESEGGADLVGSLVELLGIKGGTEAEGHAGAEKNIVGDGCDTAVVDLDLGE